MEQFKSVLLSIQQRLSEVKDLNYIDRNWGQLYFEPKPVKYPCALIDIERVSFSQISKGCQIADFSISVTMLTQRLTPTSFRAPNAEKGYEIFELIQKVHDVLQNYHNEDYAPLFRTEFTKIYEDNSVEVFGIKYASQLKIISDENAKQKLKHVTLKII